MVIYGGNLPNEVILVSGHCPKGEEKWYCVDCKTWLESFKEAEIHIEVNCCDVVKVYDKGGVDTWAEIVAKELGIKTEIYAPEVNQWNDKVVSEITSDIFGDWHVSGKRFHVRKKGYRSRNIEIAKNCDILYDIEPARSCKYCGGKGKRVPSTFPENSFGEKTCPYCEGSGAYSGGTWTLKYAKKMGKEVYKIIIT